MTEKRQRKIRTRMSPPLGTFFVGREKELEILSQELLGPRAKTVSITGPPGIGKTALAMFFAKQHISAFPGGTYNLHATPFEALDQTAEREIAAPSQAYLIIFNDAEVRPPLQIAGEIRELRKRYPLARVILTSRFFSEPAAVDLQLNLSGLSKNQFDHLMRRDMLLRRTMDLSADLSAEIFDAFAGLPLGATLVADLIGPRERRQALEHFSGRQELTFEYPLKPSLLGKWNEIRPFLSRREPLLA
jgi:hypothetical protein